MDSWITLITSLPTENATARMRAWRAIKATGSASLRDGVYLLPDRPACREAFEAIAADVQGSGGTALVLGASPSDAAEFEKLFDRSEAYAELLAGIADARLALDPEEPAAALKQSAKLAKAFDALSAIDYFPGEPRRQAEQALREFEAAARELASPGEPTASQGAIALLDPKDYKGRTWATRKRPWVDRLASAWLIRRRIDAKAKFLWLDAPSKCPKSALGFDFDGAAFTHVGARVTFEVLIASFGLDDAAMGRIGAIVHFLDVGGIQPPEAAGLEAVLSGLRSTFEDDDKLLAAAFGVFDGLLAHFQQDPTSVKAKP
ncbi:chromate resistance protein ChrB domain-containing protein [Acidovorax soli]|uniref:Chromate resistance exported protein n=1 Tax=Acidovorax soli TaxID=592050 RepID=A0A1H4BW77_9BURK|nr:chromate resistance protein ChrB domain-containing protein [Acidovorax soli]SEA52344.1 hypothetical protein SAMN05421875_11618 [Acidovorax soli]